MDHIFAKNMNRVVIHNSGRKRKLSAFGEPVVVGGGIRTTQK